jgi:geranylgeranyl diphosphate synthase, type I
MTQNRSSTRPDSHWATEVAHRVDTALHAFFEQKQVAVAHCSAEGIALLGAVRDLTMRGGKRLRPCALYAGFSAVCPDGAAERTLDASASLELLQTYLLIQDDWMDGDDERRGGPAVHAAFRQRYGDEHLGASLALLASDLAAGFAWELIARAPFARAQLNAGLGAYAQMHTEVVLGQQLDLLGHADVSQVHRLKSGSYTVTGPLKLGALLGDASKEQIASLEAFGEPLGIAFQLRDDLLGVFGDPKVTGKPAGNDLRAGKHTSLVAAARKRVPDTERGALESVLGRRDANQSDVDAAMALLQACGARAEVEQALTQRTEQADHALSTAPIEPEGATMLRELLQRLTARDK